MEKEKQERRNQKTKQVGNGEMEPYWSETLQCWVWQYYDTQGKRQTLKQRKKETKKQYWARYIEIKQSLNNGTYIGKSLKSTYTIIEEHIKQKFEDGITKGNAYKRDKDTLQSIKKCCDTFIDEPIQKVTLQDIQISKEKMKEYAQSGIDKMWRLLKKAFAIASSPSMQLIPFNIMNDENLKKPLSNKETKKIYPLTKDEREKLKSVLDNEERNHPYRNVVKMQWITAMRIGEVIARSKDDVNKNENTLHIHNTLTKDENGNIIIGEHTKTYNKRTGIDEGERFFPIDIELEEIIDEQLSNKVTNIYGLLFWDYEKNTFISYGEINSWLDRINEKYHISSKKLSTHRLRHDGITQMKEEDVDIEAIQYLVGHVEGSKITRDVYIDISKEYAFKQLRKRNQHSTTLLLH